MPFLLPVVAIAFAWGLIARGERLLPAMVALLDGPAIHRRANSLLTGRSDAIGRFGGRDVALHLQLKRTRLGRGSLVVAFRTSGASPLDHTAVAARTRDEAGRRALRSLAGEDLVPKVDDGWLQVTWSPSGFVIFPGRFVESRWRRVFEAMASLAASLEAGG